jgi:cell division septum initiation protein DivIVA
MPDRELRHMRRTELVEIILALKQSEDQLRAENAALSAQLQERQIHIENAGSIAQAALELNKVFEAAQAAADEYVASVLAANKNTAASALRAQAEAEAQQILAQAQTEAANLKARTQQQCDAETEAAARKRAQTEADCKAMLARTQQEIQQRRAAFDRRASELLDGYHSTEFLPEERAK